MQFLIVRIIIVTIGNTVWTNSKVEMIRFELHQNHDQHQDIPAHRVQIESSVWRSASAEAKVQVMHSEHIHSSSVTVPDSSPSRARLLFVASKPNHAKCTRSASCQGTKETHTNVRCINTSSESRLWSWQVCMSGILCCFPSFLLHPKLNLNCIFQAFTPESTEWRLYFIFFIFFI